MSDLTVEDVLNGRSSLRDRANLAYEIAMDEKRVEWDAEEERLAADLRVWLHDVLVCSQAELDEIEYKALAHPTGRRALEFKLDGVRLRAHYSNSEWPTEVVIVEMTNSGHSWKQVHDLADLGGKLA